MRRRRSPPRRSTRWAVLLALGGAGLLLGCSDERAGRQDRDAPGEAAPSGVHAPLRSLAGASQTGAYRVELRPEQEPVRLGALHAWLVRVTDEDGVRIRPTRLAFAGGMPQHGHGLPTAPRVTAVLADGWHRVGGVRFHMAGEWTIRIELVGPAGPDVAVFTIPVAH